MGFPTRAEPDKRDGGMASSGTDHRRAERVEVGDAVLRVWLRDGRTLTVPLGWLPRLADASEHERNEWRTADGSTIWLPGLDMTVAIDDLLADRPPYPACRDEYARVADVKVTDRNIGVWLRDGRTLTVPLHWFPRLCDGAPEERNHWEEPDASMIGWPDLDEHITVDGLLAGGWSAEQARTLGAWLLARRAGHSVIHYDIVHHRKILPEPEPLA